MMRIEHLFVFLFLGPLSAFGQVLHISPAAGMPGEKIALEISLDAPAGHTPATLKWELIFPAQLLEPEGQPEVGQTAKESGKSLTCIRREAYTFVCILAGGLDSIANGSVAVFPLRIRADAHTGTANLRVGKVDAITRDFNAVTINGSDASLEVR